MSTPPVLLDPACLPVWRAISAYLEQHGLDARGRPGLPAGLPAPVRRALSTLVDRPVTATTTVLDLGRLEAGLHDRGLTLDRVLADAGCAPRGRKEERAARRGRERDRDEALLAAGRERLGDLPWVEAWVRAVAGTVPDAAGARRAVDELARVLALADDARERSRGEIASLALGDAHRLDGGAPGRRPVGTALALRAGRPVGCWDDAELWEAAGLPSDLVSAPVLTWALPLRGEGVAATARAATAVGMPLPLTVLVLRDLVVDVAPGAVVLGVENPRLLEAAVQRGLRAPMICTSGNPRRAPTLLLRALVDAGADVRHHGDLDPAGLEITDRVRRLGVTPWRMTAADYGAALAAADSADVTLRPVCAPVPPTPWDPALRAVMERELRAVDEERVMDDLLDEHARLAAGR